MIELNVLEADSRRLSWGVGQLDRFGPGSDLKQRSFAPMVGWHRTLA